MANVIETYVTVNGEYEKVKQFINDFMEKGFKSVIPIPDGLLHNIDIFKFVKEKFGFTEEDLFHPSKEVRKFIREFTAKQLNNSNDKTGLQIYNCLKTTGYLGWKDFVIQEYGVCQDFPMDIVKLTGNTIKFATNWQSPLQFFKTVSKKTGLSFDIKIVEVGNYDPVKRDYVSHEVMISDGKITHSKFSEPSYIIFSKKKENYSQQSKIKR